MPHKIIIYILALLTFVSCTGINDPDPGTDNTPAHENYGKIVGTWECYDINYENLMYGYFVLINDTTTSRISYENALLCFNLEVEDSLPFVFGEKTIEPIEIPYDVTYKTVEYGEEGYISFGMSAVSALTPTNFSIETQVLIYPKDPGKTTPTTQQPKSITGDWCVWNDTSQMLLIFEENAELTYFKGPMNEGLVSKSLPNKL